MPDLLTKHPCLVLNQVLYKRGSLLFLFFLVSKIQNIGIPKRRSGRHCRRESLLIPSSADLDLPKDWKPPGRARGLSRFAQNLRLNGIQGVPLRWVEIQSRTAVPVASSAALEGNADVSWISSKSHPVKMNDFLDPYTSTASAWLNQCLEHHASCRKISRFSSIFGGTSTHSVIDLDHQSAMPTRLLKLIDENVQLVSVKETVGTAVYVSLSHRWGTDEKCTTTTAVDPGGPDGDRYGESPNVSYLTPSWAWSSVNKGRIVNECHFRSPPILNIKPFIEHELPYAL